MGVERIDYYSEEEYEQAAEQEAQMMRHQEPEVVQCMKCLGPMYENNPQICPECRLKEKQDE